MATRNLHPVASPSQASPVSLEDVPSSSWLTSQSIYDVERRGIFSREWLMISHKSRFNEVGRWAQFDLAGYPILIVRDRTGSINAFHNVCRHRAYNVVDGDQGKASILSCKYHGWSYGLNGKLAKAPGYQELPEFQKEKNGLFAVHVRLDSMGFVWVNMDGQDVPEVAWKDEPQSLYPISPPSDVDCSDLQYEYSLQASSACNWKLAMDVSKSIAQTLGHGKQIGLSEGFPNSCLITLPGFVIIRKTIPLSVKKTSIWYDVFKSSRAGPEASKLVDEILEKALEMDKKIAVTLSNSEHNISSKGNLWDRVRRATVSHYEREQAQGEEIWPTHKSASSNDQGSQDDILFCARLQSCGKMGPLKDIEALY
ncbi:unnamed protein product [Clonostachys byssicola]|uniref:Rieske domain-containing protein n=1 Tax=Clonostachys byssicola TaxID=160290 RepID=A0A9N9Y945_9HYPO|nr:unnamed protein product [Clonostachys byssicola]